MNLAKVKGLKYPDEYFIRFFFKKNLHKEKKLNFLELGCANANNLSLAYSYNHRIIGVDIDKTSIDNAKYNISNLNLENNFEFFCENMIDFSKKQKNLNADVLVLANSIYYITKNDFLDMLKNIKTNELIKKGSLFYLRFRAPDDFRNHKGKKLAENSYILDNGITGEDGCICTFYEENEMIDILKNELNLSAFDSLKVKYDNIQNDTKVNNSDIVIWGTTS